MIFWLKWTIRNWFVRGLKMERRSVGKRGEEKESVPGVERDFRGLWTGQFTGELVFYIHTDTRLTKRRRMFVSHALDT